MIESDKRVLELDLDGKEVDGLRPWVFLSRDKLMDLRAISLRH